METKICNNCGQTYTTDEFYKSKGMCIYCYKRKVRRNKRIQSGKPIKTVSELMAELRSLPPHTKVVLCTDIGFYQPSIVEYVREIYKDNKKFDIDKYENTIVID